MADLVKVEFVKTVQSAEIRQALDVEFANRLDTKTTTTKTTKTSTPTTTGTETSTEEIIAAQDLATAIRLDPDFDKLGAGIRTGRQRDQTEDLNNLNQRTSLEKAAATAASETPKTTAPPPSAVQTTANTATVSVVSNRVTTDLTRARQKLQRRCNHQYSLSTRRCLLCNKHRDSMVYDQ